jgi:hypothetical protein
VNRYIYQGYKEIIYKRKCRIKNPAGKKPDKSSTTRGSVKAVPEFCLVFASIGQ